jgi:hypothetical protein
LIPLLDSRPCYRPPKSIDKGAARITGAAGPPSWRHRLSSHKNAQKYQWGGKMPPLLDRAIKVSLMQKPET